MAGPLVCWLSGRPEAVLVVASDYFKSTQEVLPETDRHSKTRSSTYVARDHQHGAASRIWVTPTRGTGTNPSVSQN